MSELSLSHAEERHIHITAREGTALEDLPEAKLARSSDLIPSIERGIAAGGICGAIAGLLAVIFPPADLLLDGGGLLGLTLFGAGFGSWMSSMAVVGLPNGHIEKFEKAVSAGELAELFRRHHSVARLAEADLDIPLFP